MGCFLVPGGRLCNNGYLSTKGNTSQLQQLVLSLLVRIMSHKGRGGGEIPSLTASLNFSKILNIVWANTEMLQSYQGFRERI